LIPKMGLVGGLKNEANLGPGVDGAAVGTLRAWGADLFGNSLRRPGLQENLRTFAVRCPAAGDSSRVCESGIDAG
jgi:hypothetical protein